jgi:hypothetical protein
VRAVIDPASLVFGRPLDDGIWDVGARFGFMGTESHSAVDSGDGTRPVVLHGRPVVAYATAKGALALDVGATQKQLVTPGRLDTASARRSGTELRVALRGIPVLGAGMPLGVVLDSRSTEARIEPSGDLVVPLPADRGSHAWRIVVGRLESKPLPPISVGRFGRVRLG